MQGFVHWNSHLRRFRASLLMVVGVWGTVIVGCGGALAQEVTPCVRERMLTLVRIYACQRISNGHAFREGLLGGMVRKVDKDDMVQFISRDDTSCGTINFLTMPPNNPSLNAWPLEMRWHA